MLIAGAAIHEAGWLLRWPVPVGRDGYYYLLQMRALSTTGAPFYWTAFQFPLRALVATQAFLGTDAAVAVKTFAVCCFVVTAIATHRLVQHLTRNAACALLSVCLLTLSSLRWFFATEFISNAVGIAAFSGMCWAWSIASERPTIVSALVAIGAACIAMTTHVSAALMVVLVAVVYRRSNDTVPGLRAGILLGGAAVLSGALAVARLTCAQACAPIHTSTRVLPIPTLRWFSFLPEAIVLCAACMIVYRSARRPGWTLSSHARLVLALAMAAVAASLNPWAVYDTALTGPMERLGLWAWWFVAVLVPVGVWLLWSHHRSTSGLLPLGFAVVSLFIVMYPRVPAGATPSYLAERQIFRGELPVLASALPPDAIVVSEHGTEFMIMATTPLKARSSWFGLDGRSTSRYWLFRTQGFPLSELPATHTVLLNGWAAVREDVFVRWLGELSAPARTAIGSRNPTHIGVPFGLLRPR